MWSACCYDLLDLFFSLFSCLIVTVDFFATLRPCDNVTLEVTGLQLRSDFHSSLLNLKDVSVFTELTELHPDLVHLLTATVASLSGVLRLRRLGAFLTIFLGINLTRFTLLLPLFFRTLVNVTDFLYITNNFPHKSPELQAAVSPRRQGDGGHGQGQQ